MKKYRHFSGIVFDDSASNYSLYAKNMTLLEGIIDIFGFSKEKDVREIKRKVSSEHVAELHKLMAWLWPPDTEVINFLPPPANSLRALYMGNMRPETILRSVGRYSLYCDEVLVMNPFLNPWFIAPEYNPIIHPQDYVGETWKWVLFILQLGQWIKDKQVLLLPNPLDFDSDLRNKICKSAEERLAPQKTDLMKFLEQENPLEETAKDDFKRLWMSMPEEAMRRDIRSFNQKMSDEDVDGMIRYVSKMKENDLYFVTNPNEKGALGMHTFQSGGNLEQGLYISQLTGAHLYTDIEFRWKEILSAQSQISQQNPWSPITYGFQKLDFKFLDDVDMRFVHKVKSEGRLSNLRNFLRKTWGSISTNENLTYEQANKIALDYTDELKERYLEAESEWEKIDADLSKWLLSRTGLGAILAGGLNWKVSAFGFALEGVGKLLEARYKRNQFKKNVPLSVFVDLKNQR